MIFKINSSCAKDLQSFLFLGIGELLQHFHHETVEYRPFIFVDAVPLFVAN